MRAATAGFPFLLAVVMAGAVHGSAIARAVTAHCELRGASAHLRLPAPVTITGACGAFVIGRHRSVRRTSPNPLPVPEGASWWPYTGVWDKLVGGHLIVGRWQHRLWHSRGTFRVAYEVGVITVGPQALAFSYGNRTIHLYLAELNGHEHQIVSGEYPVGWTRGGFYTRATHGGVLRLRSSTGALKETLARRVSSYAYDNASGSLYFVVKGDLVRTVGGREQPIASLNRLGFSTRGYLQLQPLGRLIALEGSRRLVVLHSDGAPFASTRLPRGRARADGISSQLTAAPGGRVVAFTATRGNSAPARTAPKRSTCFAPVTALPNGFTASGSASRSASVVPVSPGTGAGCFTALARGTRP